jgi:hypothetical protein
MRTTGRTVDRRLSAARVTSRHARESFDDESAPIPREIIGES